MSALSDQVLGLATPYLGPAAKQFLERQCKAHCGVDFADLAAANIPELAKWINISAGLVIDKAKAEELSNKVLALK